MATWIVLLRGVNVLGRNRLPMRELAAALETAGFRAVRTYLQSGNVVLDAPGRSARLPSEGVERVLQERFGLAPLVIVLRGSALEGAVRDNPFSTGARDPRNLHLYFLSGRPRATALEALSRLDAGRERFELRGGVFYLHTPDGFASSVLRSRIEPSLGVAATARNWRTSNALLRLARGEAA